jgi:hypothetical protein
MAQPEIDSIVNIIPKIRRFFYGEPALGCSDLTHYLAYLPGKNMDHKIRPGDAIRAGGLSDQCIKAGSVIVQNVGAEVFGFAYTGMAAPIVDASGQVIGSFFVLESLELHERRNELLDVAGRLAESIGGAAQVSRSAQGEADEILTMAKKLSALSTGATTAVQEMTSMVGVIRDIADKTNVLGINAAIESARAGRAGGGFKVLADAIRGMSHETQESISVIEPRVAEVLQQLADLKAASEELQGKAERILAIVDSMNGMVETVGGGATKVSDLANTFVQMTDSAR